MSVTTTGTKLGTAYFTLIPSMEGTTAAIERELNATAVTNASKRSGKSVGSAFTTAFSGAIAIGNVAVMGIASMVSGFGDIATAAMEASDSADKFRSTMDFAGIETSTIDDLLKSTKDYADQTVYELSDIRNITAQLAANGVEGYEQLAMAAGNLNAVAGGSAETFASVGMVLTQTAGAGKLTTENWNQLADAIPGASGIIQQELLNMGAYTGDFRDAMAEGEISAEEFLAAITNLGLTDEAANAATSVSTFEGSIGNFTASVTSFATAVVDEFKTPFTDAMSAAADAISGAEELVGPFFDDLGTAFTELESTFQPFVDKFAEVGDSVTLFADEYGPAITEAFAGIGEDLPGLVEALTPVTDALGNIGATVIQDGIIAVSTAITGVHDAMGVVTALLNGDWDLAWDSFTTLFDGLTTGLNDIVDTTFPGLVSGMEDIGTGIGDAVTKAGDFFVGVFDEAGSRLDTFGTDVSTWFETKKSDFTTWAAGVGDSVSEAFTGLGDTLGTRLDEAKLTWDAKWAEFGTSVSEFWTGLGEDLSTWATDAWSGLTDWATDVWDTLGLDTLKADWDAFWADLPGNLSEWGTGAAETLSGGLDAISAKFEEWGISDTVSAYLSGVGSLISDPVTTAQGAIETALTAIDDKFGIFETLGIEVEPLATALGGFIAAPMEAAQTVVETALQAIDDKFGIFDSLGIEVETIFDEVGAFISDPIGSAQTAVETALGDIKTFIEGLSFTWPTLSFPKVVATGGYFNNILDWKIPELSIEWVPWLAEGGIVDGAQLVGVGERGPEAVVPLYGREMQPFAEAIARNLADMAGSQQVAGDTYNLYIDGEAIRADRSTIELLEAFVGSLKQSNGIGRAVYA